MLAVFIDSRRIIRVREKLELKRMEPWLLALFLMVLSLPAFGQCLVRHYNFRVVTTNTTKLCSTKSFITVNGQFPGPTLYAREDDTVIVRLINHAKENVTIHWHGIKQFRTGWSDGPAYITQCPIPPGQSFVYNFTIRGQRGTLLWHAHVKWLRATVHGAIVIFPKRGIPYPFPKPDKEKIIILGEWWKSDVAAVLQESIMTGFPPNLSDAHTINGHPGPVPVCSSQGGYTLHVETGKTYLLRIVNAAMNDELFFKIGGHKLIVVEADASYVKPFEIDTIFLSPGQTTNALLTANQDVGKYLIAITPFMDAPIFFDNMTAIGTLFYKGTPAYPRTIPTTIPPLNATPLTNNFIDSLRSLNSNDYPSQVPLTIDHSLFFTISVGLNPCGTCVNGNKLVSDINNISFVLPTIALLQAHYFNIKGVFTDDFPAKPPIVFNYTGAQPVNIQTNNGTKMYRLAFNSTVQVILQGTAMIAPENHPLHLHGFNFFVVGKGLGNFDPEKDPKSFNLVDPVERNTVGVPNAGWVAIRFRADNPGVWFMHCHLEVHTTWGLQMAFLVDNGKGPGQSLLPPPYDLPKC